MKMIIKGWKEWEVFQTNRRGEVSIIQPERHQLKKDPLPH